MNRTWLVLDCDYLCARNFFALGDLSWKELPTAVLYGFFRDMISLVDRFRTNHLAFAFDCGTGIREKTFPIYKARRRTEQHTEEEIKRFTALAQQKWQLRTDFLSYIGYENIWFQKGYEADDMIASAARNLPIGDEMVIVSADKDLWQCISDRISCFNPISKKAQTLQTFFEEWGIQPARWSDAKCIAGCSTDDIPGVDGVAELTACKFLRGVLTGKKAEAIKQFQKSLLWARNAQLVKLPLAGTKDVEFKEDSILINRWTELMDDLGMKSIRKTFPVARSMWTKGAGLVPNGKKKVRA